MVCCVTSWYKGPVFEPHLSNGDHFMLNLAVLKSEGLDTLEKIIHRKLNTRQSWQHQRQILII